MLTAAPQPLISPVIRPLRAGDHAAWLALWEQYLEFYQSSLPASVSARTWERLQNAEGSVFGLCCEGPDGVPGGFVQGVLHRSTWLAGMDCYMEDLFVHKDARGAGQGRALMQAFAVEARRRGAERFYWHTQAANADAQRLYDAVGRKSGLIQYRMELPQAAA